MAEYLKIPIQMTSNSTPEPFLIDNVSGTNQTSYIYNMFDNDQNTYFTISYKQTISFDITLDKKVILNKINIIYDGMNGTNIESFSLYGINDDNTKTLITTQNQSSYSSPFTFTFDNDKFYKKYNIQIKDPNFGYYTYIREIQLFINDSQNHILFNKNYFGFNDNDLISFDDITQYSKYSFCLYNLSDNIDKLKNHYPFRMMKLINK